MSSQRHACGYDKDSPDRQRPRFHRGVANDGWLVALVYTPWATWACAWRIVITGARGHVRRTFFNRRGVVPDARGVDRVPGPFRGQQELVEVINDLNAAQCRLPWLENRRLLISLTPCAVAARGTVASY